MNGTHVVYASLVILFSTESSSLLLGSHDIQALQRSLLGYMNLQEHDFAALIDGRSCWRSRSQSCLSVWPWRAFFGSCRSLSWGRFLATAPRIFVKMFINEAKECISAQIAWDHSSRLLPQRGLLLKGSSRRSALAVAETCLIFLGKICHNLACHFASK